VLRLKLAKEEAENEIMAYRTLREAQFQKYSSEVRRSPAASRQRRAKPVPARSGIVPDLLCRGWTEASRYRQSGSWPRFWTRAPLPARPRALQRSGNTGEYAKKVQVETDAAMGAIQISIDANKEKIITALLQSVTTVSL
jgi:hypothetical protein